MFTPVIPADGVAGWRFLQRTYDTQLDAYARAPQVVRDRDYFAQNILKVTNAEELVADRRLLSVALGAFGLQDDIDNRYFIQKVLEEGTASSDSLANRLSDKRYQDLADAFGFGPGAVPQAGTTGFAENLISRYEANGFEVATGTQNETIRVALYGQRVLPGLAASDSSVDTKWFRILGDPPLRQLFETAFNLPQAIGQIDIDQQLGVFKERARVSLGSDDLSTALDETGLEDLLTKFVARDQLNGLTTGLSSTSIALTLLQT